MKRVFIIHGYTGAPNTNWFPWLEKELVKKQIEVHIPKMPHDEGELDQEKSMTRLREVVGAVDEDTYFVGHSLGVIAILRFLESLQNGQAAGGAVLVAGFGSPLAEEPELRVFLRSPVDFEVIRSRAKGFAVITSDNDPYVPIARGEELRDGLNAKYTLMKGAGHMNESDGYTQLPEALADLNYLFAL